MLLSQDCMEIQWILIITSSLGPEKFAYYETLLYQGYKNDKKEI